MLDALKATHLGMLHDTQRMSVISNNLANANTPGYKKQLSVMRSFAEHLPLVHSVPSSGLNSVSAAQPAMTIVTDKALGSVKYTGNPLDLAIENEGMFVVQDDDGEAYTRQGSFRLDSAGRLITASGYPVLGSHGEIHLSTASPLIRSNGEVVENGEVVDKIRMVVFSETANIQKLGSNLYQVDEPAVAMGGETVGLRQGSVETSNVTPADEIIRMIETMRHFEFSSKILRSYDTMLDKSINIIGEL